MKKALLVLSVIALSVTFLASNAKASAEYDPVADVSPVHIASYVVHPAGVVLEWLLFRPLHALVSVPYVSDLFGHRVNDGVNRAEFTGQY